MTNHFTRVVDRKIATCLLVALVLPIAMQVSARADEPCPLEQKFTPSDDDESSYGKDVATDGTVAIVGSGGGQFSPVAYTLRFDGVAWAEGESLTAIQGSSIAVAINGDIAFIGQSGAAYFLGFDGFEWLEEQMLEPLAGWSFGDALALSSDWAVNTAITGAGNLVLVYSFDGQSME